MRSLCLLTALLTNGCTSTPADPPSLKSQLVGLSIDELKARLGNPDSQSDMTDPPDFGPYPSSLKSGDACTNLYYSDYNGEQVHVYCVSPDLYERILGKRPGDEELYVLDVFTFPKGTVF